MNLEELIEKEELARKYYNEEEYEKAFTMQCDLINTYVKLYERDTAKLESLNQECLLEIMGTDHITVQKIDFECLSSAINSLIIYYNQTKKEFDIINYFKTLTNLIDSENWKFKICFYEVCTQAFILDDVDSAKAKLRKIRKISTIEDVDFLTVYLDLMNNELSASEKIAITEKIIKNIDCSTLKLKYQTSLGLEFLLVDATEKAIIEIKKGINQFDIRKSKEPEVYTYYVIGGANYFLGVLENDLTKFKVARQNYLKVLSSDQLNEEGNAEIQKLIGICYMLEEKYALAERCFLDSLEKRHSNMAVIELIKNLMFMKKSHKEVIEWKEQIDEKALKMEEKLDFLLVQAQFSIQYDDCSLAEEVWKKLEEMELEDIYLEKWKDEIIKELQEFCTKKSKSSRKGIKKLLSKFYERIMLEPNFYGIGIKIKK